ncbi:MAG: hypothetical protein IJU35_05310 [Paludibacteraceae bacterium]|nr:hypothetical protein [Paludibacteraceae bacterium]
MSQSDATIKTMRLPVCKSEYQRLLMLNAAVRMSKRDDTLFVTPADGVPDDCLTMLKCVNMMLTGADVIDTADNGTALRFLLVLAALRDKQCTFTTTGKRVRPVTEAIAALKQLGVAVETDVRTITVKGPITGHQVSLTAHTTSQHVSALMLIAPTLPKGLEINIEGEAVSGPYIEMTRNLLTNLGVNVSHHDTHYLIPHHEFSTLLPVSADADWPSAIFAFEAVLTGRHPQCFLPNLNHNSAQPERYAADIFGKLGVASTQTQHGIIVENTGADTDNVDIIIDARHCPDSIPPLVVGMAVKGIKFTITHTNYLRGKESDRIAALENGLSQLGINIVSSDDAIAFNPDNRPEVSIGASIDANGDHRIAMAFGALPDELGIKVIGKECVSKSFPDFWNQI